MNRPSATTVRRTAVDLSGQVAPHVTQARDTLVGEVLPKAKETLVGDVLPKVNAGARAGLAAATPVAIKAGKAAKAGGTELAHKAGLLEPPKKSHKLRNVALVAAVGAGAYAAYNAWKLPHASDDWVHADSAARPETDTRVDADLPGVTSPGAGRVG